MINQRNIPVPYFILAPDLTIRHRSFVAQKMFPEQMSFIDLVDRESREKVEEFLFTDHITTPIEVNLMTLHQPLELFELYIQWEVDGPNGHLVCIYKSDQYHRINKQFHQIREVLMKTDFNEFNQNARYELLPSFLNIDHSNLDQLTTIQTREKLTDVPDKLKTIQEFISILRPDVIEAGKSDYIEMISEKLEEIEEIIGFVSTLSSKKDEGDL